MIKQCVLCGKEFETIKYGAKRIYCFECSPQGEKKILSKLRHRAKEIGVKQLGGCCKKCGIDKIYLLDFHHRNPEEKESSLSDLSKGYDLTKFNEELTKCDLLCANCHREFHYLHDNEGISYEEYLSDGSVAQLVERVPEEHGVVSSTLAGATKENGQCV